MDPISHAVVGWSLTRARANMPPAHGSTLAVVLGALSPDIDFLLMPTGWDRYLRAHEAGTHSLIGAAICGALAAGLSRLFYRHVPYRLLLAASLIGAFAHVAGDVLSGATIRLGWPVADARTLNLGTVAMADPYLIAVCSAGIVVTWIASGQRRRCALALLFGLGILFGVKTVSRERADAAYRSHSGAAEADGAHMIEPVWGSLVAWRVYDHTPIAIRVWHVDATGDAQIALTVPHVPFNREMAPFIDASRDSSTVRNFLRAHDFTFATASRSPDGVTTVLWSDARYCRASASGDLPQCDVWAGGTTDASGRQPHSLVRVGDLVQTR